MTSSFKKLNLLNYIVEKHGKSILDRNKIAIISVQHLLDSTGSLFQSFLDLGIPAKNISVMGKLYSNNLTVIQKMKALGIEVYPSSDSQEPGYYHELFIKDCICFWQHFGKKINEFDIKTIIVLDDGGNLISTVPDKLVNDYCIIGVEQTTSGIEKNFESKISIINVAGSAVKRFIEPAFISQAVIQKIRKYLMVYVPQKIGIFGYGNIGKALAKDLCRKYEVYVFDNNSDVEKNAFPKLHFEESAMDVFYDCDLIIGATGKDVSSARWLERSKGNKLIMSVSSGDIEFKTLLRQSENHLKRPVNSSLDNVILATKDGYEIKIFRGGTPVNFDNNIHSVLPEYIQLTRALLLIGVIQAAHDAPDLCQSCNFVKLDPDWQNETLNYWKKTVDYRNFSFAVPIEKLSNQSGLISAESLGS